MSMIQRLVRAFETMSSYELDEKDRGGMRGEQYAEYIIDDGQNGCYIRNPIIPHPRKRFYLETDFLVYMRGTLYCVEIKNYRGKVYYPARYRTVYVQKGWFIFKRTIAQQVFDRYDSSKMVQEKLGYKGAGPEIREMKNPFLKTQEYIDYLKYYLQRIDARLTSLPIYPALGFAEKTDISAIYNFNAGIMHISELPAFFEKYSDPTIARSPEPWIQEALHRLPTWDRVLTKSNEWINGTITDQALNFKGTDGRKYAIPFAQIRSIDLRRADRLSAYDDLTITYTNGQSQSYQSTSGEIRLNRFKGEIQTHKLSNLNKVTIGLANKRI